MNDGGPAFPVTGVAGIDASWGRDGMSLRDYFAAAAVPPIRGLVDALGLKHNAVAIASAAYTIADAMLAERQRKRE